MAAPKSFFGSAKLIAIWTLISRFTGLARDVRLNYWLGQSWVQDAFNYGFLIPNLFRRLFGEGALAAVFVPTFTDTLVNQDRPAAWRLLGKVLARMVVVLTAITILIELVVLLIWVTRPAGAASTYDRLVLAMTAIMLPFMLSICVVALFSSILNCLGRFGGPAAMPIVLNICMLAGIELIGPRFGAAPDQRVYGVAISVLATGVVQLLIMWPMLRQEGVRVPLRWGARDAAIHGIMIAFVPVVLGQSAILLGSFLDAQICVYLSRGPQDQPHFELLGRQFPYPLEAGALSAVTNAQRLYQFPLGVLAISLATAAFPMFSRYAAQRDFRGLRDTLARALRLAVFEGLPCGMILVVLAQPIIRLLFQYGEYTAEHTARAAGVLAWYGAGVWAFALQHVIVRGFYSLKDTRTPMWISVGLVTLNLAISLVLIWQPAIRERAFGISLSMTAALNVVVSLHLLRRRLGGRIGGRRLARSLAQTICATAIAGVAAWMLLHPAQHWGAASGSSTVAWCRDIGLADSVAIMGTVVDRLVSVMVPLSVAAAIYLGIAFLLRMEEVHWLLPGARRDDPSGSPV